MPEVCPKCGGKHFHQDEDVLDTWFSSALWPFSTLGWPEKTPELDYFYPNNVMVTGYDIIFFWVVRMVFSGLYTMGEIPFKYVYIHGLVRDEQGRKMSKSLGNGIDPLEVINEVGADALRFMLATGISPGNDMRFIRAKLESARNFANKLWNASRFTIMNLQGEDGEFLPMADEKTAVLRDEDKWILSKSNEGVKEITSDLEKFETSLAGQKIYELIWDVYCDWYIELVKGRLYGDDEEDKKTARFVLQKTLKDLLRLLHPYMPFITEEIWSYLPAEEKTADNPEGLLIRDRWPEYDASMDYSDAAARIETAMEIIKAVRAIRVEADAAPSRKVSVIVRTDTLADTIPAVESHICKIANVDSITVQPASAEASDDVMSQVITGGDILVPLEELVDKAAEIERLEKEKKRLEGEVMRVEKKLANQGFVSKAPAAVVEEERAKGEKYKEMLDTVVARLESLR
jgi:valyl-tRNA synthetase